MKQSGLVRHHNCVT